MKQYDSKSYCHVFGCLGDVCRPGMTKLSWLHKTLSTSAFSLITPIAVSSILERITWEKTFTQRQVGHVRQVKLQAMIHL